ncbi:MAG: hypothetical protein BGN91_15895 [Nitrobacter sp. 62-13]|uniref:hypothetical protein n=1 Tax=Nitrobacter sp. 62-13 TaxID=1895797 RepID=UPI00096644A3|nr:hypothetical protein [Nitrobacter sp. 62-13]OJU25407.1 MAG: hypothetical protein BGN91_15895 [Nitrobacter sp. 62-13]
MSGRLALQLAFSCKNKLAMAQSIADNVEFWLLRDVVKRWDILVKVFVNLSAWRRGVVQELIRA